MFWRIIEWTFMLVALAYGGRAVYRLWRGPKVSRARRQLHQADEELDVAQMDRVTRRRQAWAEELKPKQHPEDPSSPKEPDDVR